MSSRTSLNRPAAVLAGALALSGVLSACGQSHPAAPEPENVVAIGSLPAKAGGYDVKAEDVSGQLKEAGRRAYVTGVKLWSLREGDYLRATVEVARFAADAPVDEAHFRATVATQVATSNPILHRVGDHEVYVTTGERQVYYVWFRGRDMLLLTVPATTPGRRALLRSLLSTATP